MFKRTAAVTALLLLATACSRPGQTKAPVQAPAVPELPPAPVQVAADSVLSRFTISAPKQVPRGQKDPVRPVTAADDAGWVKAKADLVKLLEQSPLSPAPGLQEALLAYYRRPDVAALPGAAADPRGALRLGQYVSSKNSPDPGAPTILRVNAPFEGSPAWYLGLVLWKGGAALLPESTAMAFRPVTHQGRPAIVVFHYPLPTTESPLVLSAYALTDGKLQPIKLAAPAPVGGVAPKLAAPHQLELPKPGSHHPDFEYSCFGETCVYLDWADATGLSLKPTGFNPAAAAERLASTDGNRVAAGGLERTAHIDARLAVPASIDEPEAALRNRLGASVATARSGDAVARVVHYSTISWLNKSSYFHGFTRVQFRGAGISYVTTGPSHGGTYRDHRVLQETGRTYVLLLSETEPRPSDNIWLTMWVAEGGQMQQAELPQSLWRTGRRSFLSMDARLMLDCPESSSKPDTCKVLRLEGGELVTLKPGSLPAEPPATATQARQQGLAKFQSGAYAEAAQFFRQATELAPLWLDAWNDLSFAYQKAGDWPSARLAAATALRLGEDKSGAAVYNMGVSLLGLDDPGAALGYLQRAADLQPRSVDVWLALGRARERYNLRITAIEAYKKVLELEPGNKEAADGVKRMQALLPQK